MKTAKELMERLQSDKEFSQEFSDRLAAKRSAGANDKYEAVIPTAAEFGYEISKEQIDNIDAVAAEEMSEEELGRVAGGTSCWSFFAISAAVLIPITVVNTIEKTLE